MKKFMPAAKMAASLVVLLILFPTGAEACRPATLDLLAATNALQPSVEIFVDGYLRKLKAGGTAGKKTTEEATADDRQMLMRKVREKWCAETEKNLSEREIEFLTKLHKSSVMKKFSDSEVNFWNTKSLHEYMADFYPQ